MINHDEENKDIVVGAQDEQPNDENQVKQIKTTKTTVKENKTPVAVNDYVKQQFTPEMEAAALEAAKNSSAFQDLMTRRNERMSAYGQRAQNAENAVKGLAWTNLFTNLAKIAGMGYAPVVKEDTGFLDRAFAEADALRKNYYQRDDEYTDMLEKYKSSYVDAARAAHNKSEEEKYKAAQQTAKDKNRLALENTTTTTKIVEENPFKQAEHDREEKLHPLQEKKIVAQTNAANASAAKANAKAGGADNDKVVYTYANPDDGYSYEITESSARDIKQILSAISEKTKDNPVLKKQLDDDIGFIAESMEYGAQRAALGDLVAKYIGRYPEEFKDILNRSNKRKTINNTPPAAPVEDKPKGGESTNVDVYIK